MVIQWYTTIPTLLALTIFLAADVRGACPSATVMEPFDIAKYAGIWYEIKAKPSIFQSIEVCLKSDYILQGSKAFKVSSEGKTKSGRAVSSSSTLNHKTPNTGDFSTDFVAGFTVPYKVLDTDYQTYACVHSCLSIFTITNEFNFIYSRQRTLDDKHIQHCQKVFKRSRANLDDMVLTPQTNCGKGRDELRK